MDWKKFLKDVSKTVINSGDLKEEFIEEGMHDWLGYPPATDEEIEKHEARLETILPSSYRAFLKKSNGFKQIDCFIWDLLPIERLDWIKNSQDYFYQVYSNANINPTDDDYFVYGDEQDTSNFRSDYLIKTLAISAWGDSAILLLNPEVKSGDEWEAWMFANWLPGPNDTNRLSY